VSNDRRRRSFVLTERFKRSQRVDVDPRLVEHVRELYEGGRYLDAFEASRIAGPLQAWKGAAALEIGARLASNVGGDRIGYLLALRAHREHPGDAAIALLLGFHLANVRGPMAAWEHLRRFEARQPIPEERLAEILALRAHIAGGYRDFETAERLLARAFALQPGSAWLRVEQASVLLAEERREEALSALDEALHLRPWYRPAVQYRARLLHVLGRLDEAVAFLTRSLEVLQSEALVFQLLQLKRESDDETGMLELLAQLETLTPLAPRVQREWMVARRADALYLAGDLLAAAGQAEAVHEPDYDRLASRLRSARGDEKRIRLPFRFIPQGFHTCGPATLAAIAQHWGMPVTQESIVEAIAYDGTYDQTERDWCESNGFAAREFKVTWDAARLLVDAGVPFALGTVEANSAHLQAVIGYDELRETLFIQDPGEPHYREAPAQDFLTRYALTGPRGMAVVPEARRSWLEALPLPEAALFDLNHAFHSALSAHRREGAVAALEQLETQEPGGRLALVARLALTGFDGDTVERRGVIDRLLTRFPDDQRLLAWRLQLLRENGRAEDRLALLTRAVRLENAHPLFTKELASELGVDIRHHREVGRLLWKAHRMVPLDASVLTALAQWQLRTRRDEASLDLHRFAASLVDKDENFARNWFIAASAFGRSGDALAWLRWRFEAYGDRSGAPAVTLGDCLDNLQRTEEALAVLSAAIARRPEDGELLVQAARLELRCGLLDQAEGHLEQARGRCPPRVWRRAAAGLQQRRGNRREALKAWQEVLAQEPLAMDAHQAIHEQLACLEGEAAALQSLAEACARFPHHYGLNEFHVFQLRKRGPEHAEPAARRLVETHPTDPRARRMLAGFLGEMHRLEEALGFARSACDMAPDEAASHGIHGKVLAALGRRDEAVEELREATRRDINYPWAWETLVDLMSSTGERRTALELVRAEMGRQVVQGFALQVYRRLAYPIFEPRELASHLREIWQKRPDLWEAWSTLVSQELDAGNKDEAERVAGDAVSRFPLLPGAWRDLATLQRILGNDEEALRAIRRALDLNPEWPTAWLELGRLLEERGRPAEAIEALRTAVKRVPLAGDVRLHLAELLWRADARAEAWDLAAGAAEADPSLSSAWERLRAWAPTLHREEALVALAREVTRSRPGDPQSWLILGALLPPAAVDEELAAYDTAIARNPRAGEAYDLKAEALARLGRLNAAEAVIREGPWGDTISAPLRGRLAWLKAARGNIVGAMADMSRILEENHDYPWGWERLADWAERTADVPTWLRASQELIRLSPRNPLGYCHAAAAEFRRENGTEAAALLTRALQLAPGHEYAARTLLGYEWMRRDAAALEALPSLLLQGGETAWVSRAAEALAAALRRNEAKLHSLLVPLACAPDPVGKLAALIHSAFTADLPRLKPVLAKVLAECVASDRIGPSFAAVWVRLQAEEGHWDCWHRFGAWSARMGERAKEAIAEFLDQAGASPWGAKMLPALIREQGALLRGDTFLWAKVGHAFTKAQHHQEAADWLAGGESRPDVQGWMLANLMLSLKALGRSTAASEVSAAVVRRGLQDGTWEMHVPQAAFGAAQRGDLDAARAILGSLGPESPSGEWGMLRSLAESLVHVLSTPPQEAGAALSEEMHRLQKAASANPPPSQPLVAEYGAAIERMGRHAGVSLAPRNKAYPARRGGSGPSIGSAMWWVLWSLLVTGSLLLPRVCTEETRMRVPVPQPLPIPADLKPSPLRPPDVPPPVPLRRPSTP
jgi:tetratricopeptide (TPR) repeat protein